MTISSGNFKRLGLCLIILTVGASLSVLSRPSQYVLFDVDVPSRMTTLAGAPRTVRGHDLSH